MAGELRIKNANGKVITLQNPDTNVSDKTLDVSSIDDTFNSKVSKVASTDNAIARFNGTSGDLQNSGVTIDDSGNITPTGIYLGGSSSANYLDDYEEGTWTPSMEGVTGLTGAGIYVRIGNFVYVTAYLLSNTATTASTTKITGLPYVNRSPYDCSIFYWTALTEQIADGFPKVMSETTNIIVPTITIVSSSYIRFAFGATYYTE